MCSENNMPDKILWEIMKCNLYISKLERKTAFSTYTLIQVLM